MVLIVIYIGKILVAPGLDFVDGVMKQNYECLFQIPFGKISLDFNEESLDAVYQVSVVRKDEKSKAVDTDFNDVLSKKLEISLIRMTGSENLLIEQYEVFMLPNGRMTIKGNSGNIEMFFAPRTSYYLTDSRLHKQKTDVGTNILNIGSFSMTQYQEEIKTILASSEKSQEYKEKIGAFKFIIDQCEFANKHLEIDKRFGFRFVANNNIYKWQKSEGVEALIA